VAIILNIYLNSHNSIASAHIRTKFGTETITDVPETDIPSEFTSKKIQDGNSRHFDIRFTDYNTAAVTNTHSKFGLGTKYYSL